MQDLDRRLKHLDKFHQPLIGQTQRTGIAVCVGIVLRIVLKLSDVHLANQCRDILVIFISGLCLGNAYLIENRRVSFNNSELADIATILMKTLYRPG